MRAGLSCRTVEDVALMDNHDRSMTGVEMVVRVANEDQYARTIASIEQADDAVRWTRGSKALQ